MNPTLLQKKISMKYKVHWIEEGDKKYEGKNTNIGKQ